MKNATMNQGNKVEIIEVKIGEIKYTQTRPGYYYKNENGKQTRVSKAVWDQAWIDSGEAERAERLAKQAEADKEAEKAMNGKTKKARKSKDIAFEFEGVTLTAKQVKFIQLMPNDDFYENGLDSALWIDVFCDTIANEFNPMAAGAIVSTLNEKKLIVVGKQRVNGKNAKFFQFTELGKQVAKELGLN